jgi:hypothetical protein
MRDPLSGIDERLKRADDNIRNLHAEISGFFAESEYPVIPNTDGELFRKAVAYHQGRDIPLRFSILAGEIVHHLRSCLDHITWQLSTEEQRVSHPKRIEFPVFEKRPSTKDERSSYQRKVEGFQSATALEMIEDIQPYNSPNPSDDLLLILHKMDIVDKHRELVFFYSISTLQVPMNFIDTYIRYQRGHATTAEMANLKKDFKVTPQVSFREFGNREHQFVVLGLYELTHYVTAIFQVFAPELRKCSHD